MHNSHHFLAPIHPGKILFEDFMEPLGINASQLADCLGVPPGRISQIIKGQRSVTADTALRLERYFGVDSQTWLNLQTHYELEVARDIVGQKISKRVVPHPSLNTENSPHLYS
ncbi:MAG: HigA family addiction module antidote protein [Alphaproteobacteria bacterium]|nr:HigA family addiction module antidote protein [Alphaproteobacteria bacterium]